MDGKFLLQNDYTSAVMHTMRLERLSHQGVVRWFLSMFVWVTGIFYVLITEAICFRITCVSRHGDNPVN